MKKRIISLILVVVMAFLTLTGCAYNYAKDDMSKYATLDATKFVEALQNLVIADGDFGTDEDARKAKVQDAIAQAILKVTDATDKKFAGKLGQYDQLIFCYYAEDDMGNIFYASKMDETKTTSVQLGLTTLKDLNKAISDKALTIEEIKDYIYSTSSASVVGDKDVVSISYDKTWKDGETDKSESKNNFYYEVNSAADKLSEFLVGKQVGVDLGEIKITEGQENVEYTYKNVKVESIVKDNSTQTVADGDKVYVTYTLTFDAAPWYNEETKKYEFPENSGLFETKVDAEGKYKVTYTLDVVDVKADVKEEDGTVKDENKTFEGQLVGKGIGTTSTITIKNAEIAGKTVEVKYTGVKVNWIVEEGLNSFTVEYTPYEEELKDDNSNKKEETSVIGEKVILNGKKLTYHIFPVYYLDVESVSAELILREFYSVVASTEAHDPNEEDTGEDHKHPFVFDTLNEDYKNGDKTVGALVEELVTLNKTLTDNEKTLSTALKALNTAQSNLAKDDKKSESETASLVSKKDNAYTAYTTAKEAVDKAQTEVDGKIAEILACKKGETAVDAGLVADYETYQYDTLEEAYKADIKEKLAAKIIENLEKYVSYNGELPKKAVKEAYNAIMNTHKYSFYESKYTSGSSSSSGSTETNYKHYNGDFDAYLIDKVVSGKGTMDDVKAKIQSQAEETVKDIILIYVLVEAVEANWDGADVTLTKAEKKDIKKNLENTALLYQQYGLTFNYNVEDSYNAEQFDKAMNYLLEVKETEGNAIEYNHIKYSTEAEEK